MNEAPPPLITIAITAHNAENSIAGAVACAVAQDWPHKEIIVADDASTDRTSAILDDLARQYPIKVLHLEHNQGVAAARNHLIAESRGEFIAFFDDDDESAPERIRRQYERITAYEAAHAHGAPVVCYTAREQVYPDGTVRIEPTIGCADGPAPFGEAVAGHILYNHPVGSRGSMATCSQMTRRRYYSDAGWFDVAFRRSEDTDFNIRLAQMGGHFVGIDEPLVRQTMTLSADKKLEEERFYALKMIDKHKGFLDKKGRYAFDRDWLRAKYNFLEGKKIAFFLAFTALMMRHPVFFVRRLIPALPTVGYNRMFGRHHQNGKAAD